MRASDIEYRVLKIADCVSQKKKVEDDLIELKRTWPPDPQRAARRLAGHANAARGEPILWVIGLDERSGVVGCDEEELSRWFAAVAAQFDGRPPHVQSCVVPIGKDVLMALLFETDGAPFVVKNPAAGQQGGGEIKFEVPWREATAIRTARREDLLRILVPVSRMPEVELLDASMGVQVQNSGVIEVYLSAELYFIPQGRERLIIPFHRCILTAEFPPSDLSSDIVTVPLRMWRLHPSDMSGMDIAEKTHLKATATELTIDGPGLANMRASSVGNVIREIGTRAQVVVKLSLAGFDRYLSFEWEFTERQGAKGQYTLKRA